MEIRPTPLPLNLLIKKSNSPLPKTLNSESVSGMEAAMPGVFLLV